MRQIPNILSGIRLVLVGVFVGLFLSGKYLGALCIFVFAFVTDVLDGQLARQYGWITDLGKLLDPLADKMMTVAVLVCLYIGKRQPVYLHLCIFMFIKELLMILGSAVMIRKRIVAVADWPGKLATGLFAVGIVLSLISLLPADVGNIDLYFLIGATVLSYFALVFYGVRQWPKIRGAIGGNQDENR